jgi:hypothetical protein
MIEVQFDININQVEQFFDNFRFDNDGNRLATDFAPFKSPTSPERFPTIDVYDINYFYINLTAQGQWKERTQGPNDFQLVSCYVADIVELDWTDPADPDPGNVLTVIHYMRETFPGAVTILDCFQRNGVRHGQTLIPAELDEEGNVITPEQIIGQPTYPPLPKAQYLEYIPDDEEDVPATDYKQVNKTLGWADRRYE